VASKAASLVGTEERAAKVPVPVRDAWDGMYRHGSHCVSVSGEMGFCTSRSYLEILSGPDRQEGIVVVLGGVSKEGPLSRFVTAILSF
jgi:hypothetical protein